jgi:hypothetical protein
MKVAIMQPYLFPYIGYWQLINAVDKFVILDDVNYIVRGFINRNRILLNGQPYMFSIPIKKASQNKLIMDTELNFTEEDKRKFLMTIKNAYRKAPYFHEVMPMIEKIIDNPETDLTSYIKNSILRINQYLDIDTEILISSQMEKDNTLKAQDRIIEICKKLNADIYINPCGGRGLYRHCDFEEEGLKLFFLTTIGENIHYQQFKKEFVENLSIVDLLMNNGQNQIRNFLHQYILEK